MRGRLIVALAIAVALVGQVSGAPAPAVIEVKDVGLQTPESILHDRSIDIYLVSNINGNPAAVDDNGFISMVAPDGRVLALKWIDGEATDITLNAPKGMAIASGTLYVADITAVRMFDLRTGRPKGAIDLPGAQFLNDVAAGPDGSIYVTDTRADAVFRIDGAGRVTTLVRGGGLNRPNGVTVRPDGRLIVVSAAEEGEVYLVDQQGQRQTTARLPRGGLDGVVLLQGGALLVSSWGASAVYRVDPSGRADVVVDNVPSPADIDYDVARGRVLIPILTRHSLVFAPLR